MTKASPSTLSKCGSSETHVPLASDLSSGSRKRELGNSPQIDEIYSWASQLTSESRKLDWIFYRYVRPHVVRETIHKLETMSGGIIGLVGLQGVGNSLYGSRQFENARFVSRCNVEHPASQSSLHPGGCCVDSVGDVGGVTVRGVLLGILSVSVSRIEFLARSLCTWSSPGLLGLRGIAS